MRIQSEFESLRLDWARKSEKLTEVMREQEQKYGPCLVRPLTKTEARKEETARKAEWEAGQKLHNWLRLHSPRNWQEGVPDWWVCKCLPFSDAVRPINEPLSVQPPMAYGATSPMR